MYGWQKLDDCLFGLVVEDVHFAQIDNNFEWLADACAGAGIEAADHFLAAIIDEGIYFAA